MSEQDERIFLEFLRSTCDIQLFLPHASSPELFAIDELPSRSSGKRQFIIWNKNFAWIPQFSETSHGGYYLKNYPSGPVLEYFRDSLKFSLYSSHDHGRLYWPKSPNPESLIATQAPYAYDHKEFSRWYDKIVRWLKSNGRVLGEKNFERYFLPDAFLRHG